MFSGYKIRRSRGGGACSGLVDGPDWRYHVFGEAGTVGLKRTLLFVAIAVLVLAYIVQRSRQAAGGLHVEPHAAKEIEKAKRR